MTNMYQVKVRLNNFDNVYSVPNVSDTIVFFMNSNEESELMKNALLAASHISSQNFRMVADFLGVLELQEEEIDFIGEFLTKDDIEIVDVQPYSGISEMVAKQYNLIFPYDTDNAFCVVKDGKFGIVTLDGEVVIPCKMDEITALYNGVVFVKNEGKYGMYVNGVDVLIEPIFDSASHKGYDSLVDVELNGVKGYVTIEGEFISQERYKAENSDFQLIWAHEKDSWVISLTY
ncbi:MAG: WG repeat-containing protein [Bacteroidales bacterium]|nr:WG repeat-containing protein [Bacteroidales bacterium]